jgi:hypothetical protein
VARKSLLAVLLAALATAAGAPLADDRPPPAKPAPDGEEPPGKPGEEEDESWFDAGHSFIERQLVAPVVRLDRFFSDERELETERARSFVRWRSEVRFTDESSPPSFTTGVRATLRLPGLNKRLRRLRVVMAGETRDAISTLFPPEPTEEEPASEPTTGDEDLSRGDAGLRFYLWDSVLSHGDLGGGVLVRLPPGAYGRLRFRWAVPVSRLFLLRSAVTGFWRTDVRFGTSAAAEIERPLTARAAVRLGGSGTLTQESGGVEWSAELALLAAFGARVGGQIGLAVNGATEPLPLEGTGVIPPDVRRYRLYTRLRRDFYRSWLFFELEPEVAWEWDGAPVRRLALAPGGSGIAGMGAPLEGIRGRHPVWGVAVRLEVQFHGKEAPSTAPARPPPEPEDPTPADPPEHDDDPPADARRALPRPASAG